MLAFVALALAVIYPFLKRVFSFPQAWLGIAFGFSIPMAYAAQYGKLVPVAWVLHDREHVLGDRLRHRVRDGRPRGRQAHRAQVLGDSARPLRCGRRDGEPCDLPRDDGGRSAAWQLLGVLYYAGSWSRRCSCTVSIG